MEYVKNCADEVDARKCALMLALADGHGHADVIGYDIWRPVGQRHAYAVTLYNGPAVFRLSPDEAEVRRLEWLREQYAHALNRAQADDEEAFWLELVGLPHAGRRLMIDGLRRRAARARAAAAELARREPTLALPRGVA